MTPPRTAREAGPRAGHVRSRVGHVWPLVMKPMEREEGGKWLLLVTTFLRGSALWSRHICEMLDDSRINYACCRNISRGA